MFQQHSSIGVPDFGQGVQTDHLVDKRGDKRVLNAVFPKR